MKTADLTLIALFSVLIAVCSWISLPTLVPFTMQTFAVFLTIGLLGGKRGALSVLVYLLLGAVGVPVFAGFSGGMGVLLGKTGGYLIGFLVAALVMWPLMKVLGSGSAALAVAMLAGLLTCYCVGTVWFMIVYLPTVGAVELVTVLSWCVIPFIIPDLLKIALAVFLSKRLQKFVKPV